MSLQHHIAKAVGKSSFWFLDTFMNGGSSLPGQLALKIDPHLLKQLSKDYEIIVVTGTNGKTVTTALLVNILKQKYGHVLTNSTGSNMIQGIATTFLTANKKRQSGKKFAVLEIDEASLKRITEYITPQLFIFTNIFRDQMDRYGEIYKTYDLILEGAKNAPEAPILCNGDAPIFNAKTTVNPRIFFGFNHLPPTDQTPHYNTDGILCPHCHHILSYNLLTYSNLGDYYCTHCDFQRPKLTYEVTDIINMTEHSSTFSVNHKPYSIHVGGMYNIYNALAAISAGLYYDVNPEDIQKALDSNQKVFGRQETITVEDKECTLLLVKNPVGINQVFELMNLTQEPFSCIMLLNANYADGIDVSWIWDGQFEQLTQMPLEHMFVGGERVKDLTLRVQVAGIPDQKLTEFDHLEALIQEIPNLPTKKVYILATYTAMLALRQSLAEQGYIKKGLETS